MKRTFFFLIFVLMIVCAGGWYYLRTQPVKTIQDQLVDSAIATGVQSLDGAKLQSGEDGAAGLALKGINLFQGDKGIELWRLKASWAHLAQEGEVVQVDKPVIRYALGEGSSANEDDDVLNVQALKGQLTDSQRFMTLWDDVVITRFDDTITGSKMTYDAKTRIMVFPDGAALEGPTASGTAQNLEWNLEKNILVASGDVRILIKPRSETTENAPLKAPQPSPEGASRPSSGDQQ